MSSRPAAASRPHLTVAWVAALLAAPVLVQGLARLLSAWTGEPHDPVRLLVLALAPVLVNGLAGLITGRPSAALAWASALVAGVVIAVQTGAPITTLIGAAIAGMVAARGLPWIAARAPVPRGRPTAVLWGLLAALAVALLGRMSVYMADPTEKWAALAPVDFLARHSCLSSYVNGAALAARGDANIYDDGYGDVEDTVATLPAAIDIGPLTMDTYEYPPQFLTLPRALLALTGDFMAIRALWYLLSLAVFTGAALALARWLGGDGERRARLSTLALVMSPPVLITASFGNFQLMAMALSAAAMLAIFRGYTKSGAAVLAFTISAKIFPGILGVYLLASRRFKAAAWTAGLGVVYALLALALFGSRPYVDFFEYHLPRLASGETFAFLSEARPTMSNLGIFGVPFKLRLVGWSGSEADAWALGGRVAWVYTLVLVALAVWAGSRRAAPTSARERAIVAGQWLGLLGLAAMRSPYAPPEALIPTVWALSLGAAAAASRREAALLATLWLIALIVLPVPSPTTAAISLVVQAIVYGTAIWLALGRFARR